jgi:CRISPR/Cas system-associated protein Csm6
VGGPLLEAVDSGDVTPAVKARVPIAVAKIGVGGEEDQADKRADDRFSRLRELLVRLVQPGPKAAGVSASELHEVVEDAYTLLDERTKIAQWIADETDTVGLIRATEKIREILTGGEE